MKRLACVAAGLLLAQLAGAEPNEAYRPERGARVAMLRANLPIMLDLVTTSPPMGGGGGGGGASLTGTNAFSGANSFVDDNFTIIGSVTPTKILRFEVDGAAAGTTVLAVPNITPGTYTLGLPAVTNNWTVDQTYSTRAIFGNVTVGGFLQYGAAQTPDALVLGVGTTSRNLLLIESGDEAFDFAHAAATNPTLFVHSAAQSTTQWTSLSHNGTNGVLGWGAGALVLIGATQQIQFTDNNAVLGRDANSRVSLTAGNAVGLGGVLLSASGAGNSGFQQDLMPGLAKTLTESTATAFVQIAVAAGASGSTGGLIIYTIEANDATDSQARSGSIPFAAVNVGGVETCTVGLPVVATTSTEVVAVTTGTLTNTFDCDTSPTNAVNIRANAVSSLTQTRLDIAYRVIKLAGTGVITPQ